MEGLSTCVSCGYTEFQLFEGRQACDTCREGAFPIMIAGNNISEYTCVNCPAIGVTYDFHSYFFILYKWVSGVQAEQPYDFISNLFLVRCFDICC